MDLIKSYVAALNGPYVLGFVVICLIVGAVILFDRRK